MKTLLRNIGIASLASMLSIHVSASHTNEPETVALVGSVQEALGCPGDWQPECSDTLLENTEGDIWFGSFDVPAGEYEIKIAINGSWNENYGAGGAQDGPNIPLDVEEDQVIDFYYDHGNHRLYIGEMSAGDLTAATAHWISADTFAWDAPAEADVSLHYADDAGISITPENTVDGSESISLALTGDTVSGELAERFPHLSNLPTFTLPEAVHEQIPSLLRQQIVLVATNDEDQVVDATGLQIPGVLDDVFGYDGELGPVYNDAGIHAKVWAPTARSVNLQVFADGHPETNPVAHAMTRDDDTGVWSVSGGEGWDRMYYLYEVEVYVPLTQRIETTISTDPYTVSAATDGKRSQFVNLADADLKPEGWDELEKPSLERIADAIIYEIHVRDFSVHDPEVPEEHRGKFTAFTLDGTHGVEHLKKLVDAGMTHIHLLPVNDCATIPEDPEDRVDERELGLDTYGPASEQQQAIIWEIRDQNAFNWCYDPHHFNLPEGSYSSDPDGVARIIEFRQMVQALNALGLRVVVDVVYNHTNSAGLGEKSVFDKIVPGYYHRLEGSGGVAMSTCCPGTATEHSMMEKFMIDSIALWAEAYKVDGFRFDLMGHHSLDNMRKVREALDGMTEEDHGIDGAKVLLYGEGWNFGEVADNARFIQATQNNMAGEDIAATFNDRFRDAIRGGSPFDSGVNHVRNQVFVNGLYLAPNHETGDATLQQLLRNKDSLRIGLAGSLRDFTIMDHEGNTTEGRNVFHHGQAGYAHSPLDVINYAGKHDNETLFDINQYKLPLETSIEDRARVQVVANSLVLMAQGTPFMQAGQELLRSKSMDRNTYNSGDWFNVLDFTYETNGWGRGLPVANENEASWDVIRPRLEDSDLAVSSAEITHAFDATTALLRIRASSPLFSLETAEQVMDVVNFNNTGAEQVPGLIVMSLTDVLEIDANYEEIVVVFNAATETQSFEWTANDNAFELHPIQAASGDSALEDVHFDGSFNVPARTTAVFVSTGPAEDNGNGDADGNGDSDPATPSRRSGSISGFGVLMLLMMFGALMVNRQQQRRQ
ncbi:pullulanase-type alpha-1,6-glucosidase [Marinimicrobium sp. ABcell2]|uniref:pullulanase-type alpha-1,6-glucosidase n=1 Tax=Marinimicrobium sp. ABcell2 TaxID=3069751 RepID=UPI0027B36AE4|nr:pullulanase-type alpha-1,6-glucosidase [Marinimicrobium sp. ABcell2]MDQ2077313.1 pullulanase-type alpha-1,6-glucosidase [Marinimicrobium sp. ABcell2]